MLDAIRQSCQNYYNGIPADTFSKAGKSALYTFTVTWIWTTTTVVTSKLTPEHLIFNTGRPLFAAGVALSASLIYSLTAPFFNKIFGDNRMRFHSEIIKQMINTALTSVLINCLTNSKVNLFALPLFGSISMNMFKGIFNTAVDVAECLDQDFADEVRILFRDWGLSSPDGSGSVFINFGMLPGFV